MRTDKSLLALFEDIKGDKSSTTKLTWDELLKCMESVEPVDRYDTFRKKCSNDPEEGVIDVPKYARILASMDQSSFDNITLPPDAKRELGERLRTAQAELDRLALVCLRHSKLVSSFFISETHDLTWLVESDGSDVAKTIGQWHVDAVNGNFPLFLQTYWLWTMLVAKGINREVTGRLSRALAFTGISYSMFFEAKVSAEYGIEFYTNVLDKSLHPRQAVAHPDVATAAEYEIRLRMANLMVLGATAVSRLGEIVEAEALFDKAEACAEAARVAKVKDDPSAPMEEYHKTVMSAKRERLRMYCHLVFEYLQEIVASQSAAVQALERYGIDYSNVYQKVREFESKCADPQTELPINWDTAARCLLFFSTRTDASLQRVDEYLTWAYDLLEISRLKGTYESTIFTRTCLLTTSIIAALIRGDVAKAKDVHRTLTESLKHGHRRPQHRRGQLDKVLSFYS